MIKSVVNEEAQTKSKLFKWSKRSLKKKLKELTKFETKIEQKQETHKKSLTFFQENDNCHNMCTQKIDDCLRQINANTKKIQLQN